MDSLPGPPTPQESAPTNPYRTVYAPRYPWMPCHLPNGARDFVLIPTLHDVRATAFRGNCLSGWEDQWNVNTEFAAMEIARAADICVSPTPMRLTGLISPMERSEDQEPPPRAAGPYFIVLFGTEEGIDGVVCGIWKDIDPALVCAGESSPVYIFNSFDAAWFYWFHAFKCGVAPPFVHSKSLWKRVVTYQVLIERQCQSLQQFLTAPASSTVPFPAGGTDSALATAFAAAVPLEQRGGERPAGTGGVQGPIYVVVKGEKPGIYTTREEFARAYGVHPFAWAFVTLSHHAAAYIYEYLSLDREVL